MRLSARMSLNMVVVPTLAVLAMAGMAEARCSGDSFTVGDSEEEVLARCGAPLLRVHRDVGVTTVTPSERRRSAASFDDWTYGAGATELMQTLHFRDDKLSEVAVEGYGRQREGEADGCRNGELLAVGDTPAAAYLKCGEPLAKERLPDKTVESEGGEERKTTTVTVEEWTYRYGPDAPGYAVRFEDGVAAEVRERAFGK